MSTTYDLETRWVDTDGNKFSRTFKHLDGENATDAQVKTFTQAYITNGSFLKNVPTSCIEAVKAQHTRTPYDLS